MADPSTTTASSNVTDDVNAILGGMNQSAPAPLPPQLTPGFRAPLPSVLAPDSGLPRLSAPPAQLPLQLWQPPQLPRMGGPRLASVDPYGRPSRMPQDGDVTTPLPSQLQPGYAPSWQQGTGPATQLGVSLESGGDPGVVGDNGLAFGLLQNHTDTFRRYAQRMGIDTSRWADASKAPENVQIAVGRNIPIREYGQRTRDGIKARFPWATDDMTMAQIDQIAGSEPGQRTLMQPTPRPASEWGSPPPGAGMDIPGAMPTGNDLGSIMGRFAPALLGIASLAAGMPLQVAITAYSGMEKARQNGQELEYAINKDRWQNAFKEHQAQQGLELDELGKIVESYRNNPNPDQEASDIYQLGLRMNDPTLQRMAQARDFKGIETLAQRRDMYNQPLAKWQQQQEEQKNIADAAGAMDQEWLADPANAGKDQNSPEFKIAHAQHIGQATDAIKGKTAGGKALTPEQQTLDAAVDADVNQWVAQERAKDPPHEPTKDEIAQKRDDFLNARKQAQRGAGRGADQGTGNWTFTDADTHQQRTIQGTVVPGQGIRETATGKIFPVVPGTSQRTTTQGRAAAPGDIEAPDSWPGMPQLPPPNSGISKAAWALALQWAATGRQTVASRDVLRPQVEQALPVAQKALGIGPQEEYRQAIRIHAEGVAADAIARNFGAGQASTQMRSLNTVADHLVLVREYADALDNSDLVAANRIAQRIALERGEAPPVDFEVGKTLMADEVVRLLTNTGGTLSDREDMQKNLSVGYGPEQLHGAIDTIQNFTRGRFEALQTQYVNIPGAGVPEKAQRTSDFRTMLTPDAQRLFEGQRQPIPGYDQSQQQPEQQPAPPPEAIEELRQHRNDPAYLESFRKHFGDPSQYLGQ